MTLTSTENMNSKIPFSKESLCFLIPYSIIFILNFNGFSQSNPGDFINNFSITKQLKVPIRAAIDLTDNIYVTDTSQKCIVQYDSL